MLFHSYILMIIIMKTYMYFNPDLWLLNTHTTCLYILETINIVQVHVSRKVKLKCAIEVNG